MKGLANIASTREVLLLDALRYSLELERKEFLSLKASLRKIERKVSENLPLSDSLTLKALSSSWSIIDTVHRIHGLVAQVPRLQRASEIRAFRRATLEIKDFRNLYQHLNTEIPKINGPTNPIMGVLSWVINPQDSITVYLGSGTPEIHAHTLAIDTHNGCFAQNLLFSSGNKGIELDRIHSDCRTLAKFVEKWLKQYNNLSDIESEPSIIKFGIRIQAMQ
jgi:hypothetical protein